jgi:hypothetical protein
VSLSLADLASVLASLERLERRGVITTKPEDAAKCCGLTRDRDGCCRHRPGHPAYVGPRPAGDEFDADSDWRDLDEAGRWDGL